MRHGALLTIAITFAFSAAPAGAKNLCASVFLGDSWFISERVAKNKFITNRDIYDYKEDLHPDFSASLAKLGKDQHLIDLGAGKAKFQIDYLNGFKDLSEAPQTTAVAYKLDRWFALPKFKGKLDVKEGAFETQATSEWKKADLITDNFGVISYSQDLQITLQKVFDLMNVHGELYINSSPYRMSFKNGNIHLGLLEFLQTIQGLRVEGEYGVIKVTKEEETILVPQLTLIRARDGLPPYHTFEIFSGF